MCVCVYLPLPSNQIFYRQITGYKIVRGDHEVPGGGGEGG